MSTIGALDYLPHGYNVGDMLWPPKKVQENILKSLDQFRKSSKSAGCLSKFSEVLGLTVELSLDGLSFYP